MTPFPRHFLQPRCKRYVAALGLVAAACLPATAADITVLVTHVQQTQGQVMLGLFDNAQSFPKTISKGVAATAMSHDGQGQLRMVLADVAPGRYALSAFHDLDGNGKLTTNLLGIPTEPYGFANQARGTFGPPAFEEAMLVVGDQPITLRIDLK